MTRVLVTGAGGQLGRALLPLLTPHAAVTTLGRRAGPSGPHLTWTPHDLLQGPPDLAGVDTVIHLATNALKPGQDERMTRHVIQAAQAAGSRHVLYMSIVGLERMQAAPYYAEKLRCEALLEGSGLPLTILRATQFTEFLDGLLGMLRLGPLQLVPTGVTLQPLPARAAAERLADLARQGPQGRVPDLCGPQSVRLDDLARARGGLTLPLPLPLPLFRAWQHGRACGPVS